MTEVLNLDQITTTSITSLDLAVKPDKMARDTYYTALFRAKRPSGQYGEYFHTFLTNSPPENGKILPKFVSNLIMSARQYRHKKNLTLFNFMNLDHFS